MDAALREREALGRMRTSPNTWHPASRWAMRGAKGKLSLGKPDAVGWHYGIGGGGTNGGGGGEGSLGGEGEIRVPST